MAYAAIRDSFFQKRWISRCIGIPVPLDYVYLKCTWHRGSNKESIWVSPMIPNAVTWLAMYVMYQQRNGYLHALNSFWGYAMSVLSDACVRAFTYETYGTDIDPLKTMLASLSQCDEGHKGRDYIAKDPEGLDSDRWIPMRGGARIPRGLSPERDSRNTSSAGFTDLNPASRGLSL